MHLNSPACADEYQLKCEKVCFYFFFLGNEWLTQGEKAWESAFYQNEWAKINANWVILVF